MHAKYRMSFSLGKRFENFKLSLLKDNVPKKSFPGRFYSN